MARGWTVEEHEELRKALATGASEIEFEDKRLRYRSQSAMQTLLRQMEQELGIGEQRPSSRAIKYDSGL